MNFKGDDLQIPIKLNDLSVLEVYNGITEKLLKFAATEKSAGYRAILMQGSDTVGLEKLLNSILFRRHHLLILVNGNYGMRFSRIATKLGIRCSNLNFQETGVSVIQQIKDCLLEDHSITHVVAVHCETTGEVQNPIKEIADLCAWHKKLFVVDASNSFGLVNIPIEELGIDILFSSSGRRLRSLPGISFAFVRKRSYRRLNKLEENFRNSFFEPWLSITENPQLFNSPPIDALFSFNETLIKRETEG